jgi:hypothetical protein
MLGDTGPDVSAQHLVALFRSERAAISWVDTIRTTDLSSSPCQLTPSSKFRYKSTYVSGLTPAVMRPAAVLMYAERTGPTDWGE